MKGSKRWNVAQSYEKEYWKSIANKIAVNSEINLSWYNWKASELEKKLNLIKLGFQKDSCRVLEIGSGPVGIISYLGWGERIALDPLANFYAKNSDLVKLRDTNVNYIAGTGEQIPFPGGYFSFVIIDNVLDHVKAPDMVLDEINRVLSDNGILYLELNIHTYWGCILHSIMAKLNIDRGHPHSYTANKIRCSLGKHKFSVLSEAVNDYHEARQLDRNSSSLKSQIKGYTGLSEFIYSALCSRI